ncbi:MAG: transcriptional repressor [Planctomycetota bacterium]
MNHAPTKHSTAREAPHRDQMREAFRREGLRCTRQREAVYGVLMASHAHPTAEEVFLAVRSADAGISLATVYNTLETLVEKGLCRRLPNAAGSGPARYDADTSDHVHLATPDGKLLDIPEDLSEEILDRLGDDLVTEIERRTGIRVGRMSVQLVADRRDED